MSNRYEIAAVNRGLFNRNLLIKSVTDAERRKADEIKKYFETTTRKNPYRLSSRQLDSLSESDTIDYYVTPILELLGFEYRKQLQDTGARFPDIWLFLEEPEETSREYLQRNNLTLLEAKKYKVDLDIGENRTERPPAQTLSYIQTNQRFNPNKRWAILSNGYKWRLYSADGIDKFIEFDIDHALENRDELELFCLVFSPESFKLRRDRTDRLTELQKASLDSWVSVTDEIQKRGNDILLSLVNGFYDSGKTLGEAKTLAYQTLFRLLFTLYIESKHLIPKATVKYTEKSLRNLLHAIYESNLEEYEISDSLNELFELYDTGKGVLPAKYGGEHFERIAKHRIRNKWLREALELLTVFETNNSEIRFFDYSSLNVELIGNIYESTLALVFEVERGKVTIKKIKKKKGTEVHSTGTTYTPPNVVKYLIEDAIPSSLKAIPTVCDPACGSGHFLIQTLRHLSKAVSFETTKTKTLQEHKRKIALAALFGTDINPLAGSLARLMFSIETAESGIASADFRSNIRKANALILRWKDSNDWLNQFDNASLSRAGGFDYVVGNPPYVRADEPGELENRKRIAASGQYLWLHKKWDLFIPFIELAFGLTRKTKGKVAYVVSDGITYAPYAERCVSELVKSCHVEWVSHFSEKFPNWAFPATCFVLNQAKKFDASERRIHDANDPSQISTTQSVENAFENAAKQEVNKVSERWKGLRLGDLYYISVGMVLNSHEKLKKMKFEKDDLLKRGEPDSTHPVLYLDNEDLGAGVIARDRQKNYIEYGPGLRAPKFVRRPTFPELHTGKRVLLSSSKNFNAAVCVSDDVVVSHNTLVLKMWNALTGIDNRQISKKSKLSSTVEWLTIPKPFSDRIVLEELSDLCSEDLLVGILISPLFKAWVTNDKRHKHVLVPDVITGFPIPIAGTSRTPLKANKYGLEFQTDLKKLRAMKSESAEPLLIGHIENIVRELRKTGTAERKHMLQAYLGDLVQTLYRPVFSEKFDEDYGLGSVLQRVLSGEAEMSERAVLKLLEEKVGKSGRQPARKVKAK